MNWVFKGIWFCNFSEWVWGGLFFVLFVCRGWDFWVEVVWLWFLFLLFLKWWWFGSNNWYGGEWSFMFVLCMWFYLKFLFFGVVLLFLVVGVVLSLKFLWLYLFWFFMGFDFCFCLCVRDEWFGVMDGWVCIRDLWIFFLLENEIEVFCVCVVDFEVDWVRFVGD